MLGAVPLQLASDVCAQPLSRFVDEPVFTELNAPTVVRFHPDGRVFVAEKRGVVRVFDSLSDATPTTFVDLRGRVHDYWDRGLLGMALHPDFAEHPYVYVLYTLDARPGESPPSWGDECPDPPGGTEDGCVVQARLSRFRAAGNAADGGEEVLIQNWCQQFPSHSIGALAFGPDGALYVSGGDGASFNFVDYGQVGDPINPCGDPPVAIGALQEPPDAEGGALRSQALRNSASTVSLDGTVLRVDPETGLGLADNPLFGGGTASDDGIIAYGLRNPFRIALRPGTSEIWIGDVGWNEWEEINVIQNRNDAVVENFGWPCFEGRSRQEGYDASDLSLCESLYATPSAHSAPLYTYRHGSSVADDDGCDSEDSSISGLAFYDGGSFPAEYGGALFFADYSRRCIWAMLPGSDGRPAPANRRVFLRGAPGAVDLTIGPDGALYYAALTDDSVRRVRYSNGAPLAQVTASPTHGSAPLTVELDGSASTDPNGDALSYAWDLDGDGELDDSTEPKLSHTFTRGGTISVRLRVRDPGGLSDDETVQIDVDNRPPKAIIDAPVASDLFRVGEAIAFSGHAEDPDQGPLAASDLSWEIVLQHCSHEDTCHEHTVMGVSGVDSGELSAPDHEYPSYIEVRLTATDALGLSSDASVSIQPETTTLELTSEPEGLVLAIDGRSEPTPFRIEAIVGSAHTVSASSPQTLEGSTYAFASWSDGEAATHVITLGASALTLHALFSSQCGDGELQDAEACDDGNNTAGDCCSAACTFELEGSVCPDDGDACTLDHCDGAGACLHPPNEECDGVEPGPDAGEAQQPVPPQAGSGSGADSTRSKPRSRRAVGDAAAELEQSDAGDVPIEVESKRRASGSCMASLGSTHANDRAAWLTIALSLCILRGRSRGC